MFLNESPKEYTPLAFFVVNNSLIDNDVKYYGFQKSKEYQDVYDRILSSPVQTMDIYDSPYFGQGNGAYRELDRVYEAYKSNLPITTMPITYPDCPPGTMMVDGVCVGDPSTYGPRILIDQDVNYYGFLQSTEYNNWMKSIEGLMLTMDMYDSPYFGMQGSGAYRELDRVYEAYKSNLPITTMPITDPNVKRVTSTTSTINPLLILAAAAFFIGG